MKAMILSAGLGTRLRPLTYQLPKPLIRVSGKPIIFYVIELLKKYDFKELIINLYHLPQSIVDYLGDGSGLGVKITYSWEKQLLGTAGAINEVKDLLEKQTFLVINSDILTDIDLHNLVAYHFQKRCVATLGIKVSLEAKRYGPIGLDRENRIVSFVKTAIGEPLVEGIFTGISVLEPTIFRYISGASDGLGDKVFPQMLLSGENLYGYTQIKYWLDVGTPERLAQAEEDLRRGKVQIDC